MKKLLTTAFFCILNVSLFAQEGVHFFQGTWAELLAQAKQENKPIFVDVHTDWCPPCKKMDQEVFPLSEVGQAYNSAFLNYRLDAQKGEGPALAKQYNVHAYPTYLYLDSLGNLLLRTVDYQEPPQFIAKAQEALKKNKTQLLSGLEAQYQQGNRDRSFLKQYIEVRNSFHLETTEALDFYFEGIPLQERMDPAMQLFFLRQLSSPQAKAFTFLIEQFPSLDSETKLTWAPQLYNLLYSGMDPVFQQADTVKASLLFHQMSTLLPYLSDKHTLQLCRAKLLFAKKVKDAETAKQVAYDLVKPFLSVSLDSLRAEDKRRYERVMQPFLTGEQDSTDATFREEKKYIIHQYTAEITSYLYEASNTFYEVLDSKDPALADALKWAEHVVSILPRDSFPNTQFFIDFRDRLKKKVTGTNI